MSESEITVRIVLVTLFLIILVAGIIIAYFIMNRQRNEQRIKLIETEVKFERELRQVEEEIGEETMEFLAREIHDGVGHELTCLRLALENMRLDHPDVDDGLTKLDRYLTRSTDQLRMLSRSMNGSVLSKMTLAQALDMEMGRQRQLGRFEIDWLDETKGRDNIESQKLMLFRIFQEILNNAVKHAEASKFIVRLKDDPVLSFQFRDNGKGFDLDMVLQGTGASGLRNIIDRAKMIGFSCQIDSGPGEGCAYLITEMELD